MSQRDIDTEPMILVAKPVVPLDELFDVCFCNRCGCSYMLKECKEHPEASVSKQWR